MVRVAGVRATAALPAALPAALVDAEEVGFSCVFAFGARLRWLGAGALAAADSGPASASAVEDPADFFDRPLDCRSVVMRPLGYSYIISRGPGKSHESPSRSRSRQFSQLWPSRASTKRTSMPVPCSTGANDRFS